MNKPAVDELIQKYQTKEPTQFIQYDVFLNAKADDMSQLDEDGDSIFETENYELMRGSDIRIFIKPGTPPGRVRNALKKITKRIKKNGLPNFEGPNIVKDPFANS